MTKSLLEKEQKEKYSPEFLLAFELFASNRKLYLAYTI